MVILLYAERRTTAVGEIASHLARAITLHPPAPSVAVVGATPGSGELSGLTAEPFPNAAPPDDVTEWLGGLAARHGVVVVAVAGPLSEQVLAAGDRSDRVLLACDPTVPSVRGTQRALKHCQSLGYDAVKVRIVLHGFADDAPLSPHDAATAFRREIFWHLPDAFAPAAERAASFAGLAARLLSPHEA